MTPYQEKKAKHQTTINKIMEENKVFWAFSQEQLAEGIKKIGVEKKDLVDIGHGGFMPRANFDKMLGEINAENAELKRLLKADKDDRDKAILYELNNHEAFYTGRIDEVVEIFKGVYTIKQIKKVFDFNKVLTIK